MLKITAIMGQGFISVASKEGNNSSTPCIAQSIHRKYLQYQLENKTRRIQK